MEVLTRNQNVQTVYARTDVVNATLGLRESNVRYRFLTANSGTTESYVLMEEHVIIRVRDSAVRVYLGTQVPTVRRKLTSVSQIHAEMVEHATPNQMGIPVHVPMDLTALNAN